MIPQSDIDNAAAGYGKGATMGSKLPTASYGSETIEAMARIAFKAGCEWAMSKVRTNRDNPVKPKEMANAVILEAIEEAAYKATEAKFGATNGFPTFTGERTQFAIQITIDYMLHYFSGAQPKPSVDWIEAAAKDICQCWFGTNERNLADVIRKHAPITPMPADYDDCPKGGGGE